MDEELYGAEEYVGDGRDVVMEIVVCEQTQQLDFKLL